MKIAVVLQKPASLSKTRLQNYLSLEERIELVYVMLCDVLKQLSLVNNLDYFAVMTKDSHVIKLAYKFGGKVFYEEVIQGMNRAVLDIQNHVGKEVKHMLVLPGDIPLISAEEIDNIIQEHLDQNRTATILPCRKGLGTNGLLLSPPQIMPTFFGQGSMEKHSNIAHERNLHYDICHARSISYDIDTKDDLLILNNVGSGTLTSQYIKDARLLEK